MNRILIAAADLATAEGIQSALSSAGYQTAVVSDCQQFLAFCNQHSPDLSVVDLELPGGSIWTVSQAIRSDARLAAMPLVGLGSHLSDTERQHAQALGFGAIEEKPASVQSLVNSVRKALDRGTATNITQMPDQSAAPQPAGAPPVHDPVGVLLKQVSEIRSLTADLKPFVPSIGDEAPELFEYIENSGLQIIDELNKISVHGIEASAIALQDKDLRHDFRNMIGSVTGFSELLLMEATVQGEARAKFTRIREICRNFCDVLDEQKAAAA